MFKIYTDTSANLLMDDILKYDLELIPLHYTVGGKESPSSAIFDGKAFYDAMRKGAVVQTSMVNTSAFCETFEKSLSTGIDVIYIGISSGISGTYQASVAAANDLRIKYPERKIAVIDTRAASLGEGLCVLYAAGLKDSGMPFEEVVARTEEKSRTICQYFTVDDLMYLKRGGRISAAAALVGNILSIKPILKGDKDGKIVVHHKVRGRKKALDALAAMYRELATDNSLPIGIAHADCQSEAEELAAALNEAGQTGEIIMNWYEPVTGGHVGPGTVALFFYGSHR